MNFSPQEIPTGLRLWALAARPRTLSISVAPVLVGSALAWQQTDSFRLAPMLVALAAAMLIQIGTNLHNDVADAVRGADRPSRQGPPRVTALGWVSPARVRLATFVAFGLAALAGIYLVAVGGWPILALGVCSLIAGWAYSGGPRPISYSPFGEVCVVLFFGIGAVAGCAWLQTETVTPAVLIAGLVVGLPAAAVLTVNNTRDIDADRLAGRRTLSIQLGVDASKWLIVALMLLPFPLMALAPMGALVGLGALPLALAQTRALMGQEPGPAYNGILAATARTQLVMAALMSVGMVLA